METQTGSARIGNPAGTEPAEGEPNHCPLYTERGSGYKRKQASRNVRLAWKTEDLPSGVHPCHVILGNHVIAGKSGTKRSSANQNTRTLLACQMDAKQIVAAATDASLAENHPQEGCQTPTT